MKNCSSCHCVAYCSDECKKEDEELHKTVCQLLDNCIQDYRYQITMGDKLKCYLPPRMPQQKLPEQDFERMFAKDCEGLFSQSDSAEYRKSQVKVNLVKTFRHVQYCSGATTDLHLHLSSNCPSCMPCLQIDKQRESCDPYCWSPYCRG